ncbi:MAG: hypothetical protein ABI068_11725 [Ktedonobacterales bacterium]
MASTGQNSTPFSFGWWSFDLGAYRPCDGTYCFSSYGELPPIRELNGTLDWLGPLDPQTEQSMQLYRNAPEKRGKLAAIEAEATKLGLTLPEAFVRLMGSPELQDRIPSCTACTFDLSAHIVPCIGDSPGYIIRFLRDQQDVLLWYLYLTPQGEQWVLVSPYEFGDGPDENPNDVADDERTAVIAHTRICAPSFEAFVYRFWLENTIWFTLNTSDSSGSLTNEQQHYVDHYRRQSQADS